MFGNIHMCFYLTFFPLIQVIKGNSDFLLYRILPFLISLRVSPTYRLYCISPLYRPGIASISLPHIAYISVSSYRLHIACISPLYRQSIASISPSHIAYIPASSYRLYIAFYRYGAFYRYRSDMEAIRKRYG